MSGTVMMIAGITGPLAARAQEPALNAKNSAPSDVSKKETFETVFEEDKPKTAEKNVSAEDAPVPPVEAEGKTPKVSKPVKAEEGTLEDPNQGVATPDVAPVQREVAVEVAPSAKKAVEVLVEEAGDTVPQTTTRQTVWSETNVEPSEGGISGDQQASLASLEAPTEVEGEEALSAAVKTESTVLSAQAEPEEAAPVSNVVRAAEVKTPTESKGNGIAEQPAAPTSAPEEAQKVAVVQAETGSEDGAKARDVLDAEAVSQQPRERQTLTSPQSGAAQTASPSQNTPSTQQAQAVSVEGQAERAKDVSPRLTRAEEDRLVAQVTTETRSRVAPSTTIAQQTFQATVSAQRGDGTHEAAENNESLSDLLPSEEAADVNLELARDRLSDRPIQQAAATNPVPQMVQYAVQQHRMQVQNQARTKAETAERVAQMVETTGFAAPAEIVGLSQLLTEATLKQTKSNTQNIARRVSEQLGDAFATTGEKKVEVLLNPKELGRVEMQVETTETGVKITIDAERPETSDLMREHIDQLKKEFQQMGFTEVRFEFKEPPVQQPIENEREGQMNDLLENTDQDLDAAHIVQSLRLGETGLNLRV
ncbi:flagellar hook-length control protein FliK [Epibacterium ulvae]|uniref:flagellar hook-length control protein FliK n=1 Tax=Epibacterium ulvae TaxID=1156985 RepID=UPI0024933AE4|nr:flagellar hook-length control protein FliK [Epibacterium ulvae]